MPRPPRLETGDQIGIAAPAGPILSPSQLQHGIRKLRQAGYPVAFERSIFSRNHYLAGTEERRSRELVRLLSSPLTRGVLLARGGYGSLHLLPHLHRNRRRLRPKIFMGYSDATALLVYLTGHLGWVTFHGPMVLRDIAKMKQKAIRQTLAILEGKGKQELWKSGIKILKAGRAKGPILGGCLSLIVSLLGTPFQPRFRGKILFLEDTGERFYQVDRMITQLKLAGLLKGVRGIILGPFRQLGTKAVPFFKDLFGWFRGPIILGYPSGHCTHPQVLPFGVPAVIDTARRSLKLLSPATSSHG